MNFTHYDLGNLGKGRIVEIKEQINLEILKIFINKGK